MLIKKSDLKDIIQESFSFVREGHGAPCPISIANQLHAAGFTPESVNQFIDTLLHQYQLNRNESFRPATGGNGHVTTPNRGGMIGGVGFGRR